MEKYTFKRLSRFIIPSAIGIFLFLCPVPFNGSLNIPVAVLTSKVTALLKGIMPNVVYAAVLLSAIGYVVYKLARPKFMEERKGIRQLFDISNIQGGIRIIAAIFSIMLFTNKGPEFIIGSATGPFVVHEFLQAFITTIFFAGMLMTLLLDYGFMDFIGTLVSKIFRKVFTLPGRAAIDCIASWLGDAVVAVIITSDQYDRGYYSAREASVIATTFSAVSISFTLIILFQLGLDNMFFPFFYTTLVAGMICALIMPRIPPLSRKKDEYTIPNVAVNEEVPQDLSLLQYAINLAVKRADNANYSITIFLKKGVNLLISCGINTIPLVLFVGTVILAFNEYTPIFQWLSYPFIPLLKLLGIPEAEAASSCMLVGFGDNFVPAIIASATIKNEMTKFIVGSLSINQLIYMSQVGALILGSHIPVKFQDLVVIFLERTFICLIIITIITKLFVF